MIKELLLKSAELIDRSALQREIAGKQRLYAQMLKDKLHGSTMDKLSEEIAALNIKIHGRARQ